MASLTISYGLSSNVLTIKGNTNTLLMVTNTSALLNVTSTNTNYMVITKNISLADGVGNFIVI
jgi:hypothetical protein